jgi:hypothetical protein
VLDPKRFGVCGFELLGVLDPKRFEDSGFEVLAALDPNRFEVCGCGLPGVLDPKKFVDGAAAGASDFLNKSFAGFATAGVVPKFIPELDAGFGVWPKENGESGGFGSEFVVPVLKIDGVGAGDCGCEDV